MDADASRSIDRLSPTIRPDRRVVMRQNWRLLSFLHWEVPPDRLRALLPTGLELDLFEGRAYVGLVPFTMTGVRPVGLPAWRPLSDFHETNVRIYVHHEGRDPGVWFFSLDAANPIAVALARAWFHLPYYHASMSVTREPTDPPTEPGVISYESERRKTFPIRANCAVRVRPMGPVAPARPGTLDHFLVERYILYASNRGRLYQGRVHHPPYPLQAGEVLALDESLLAAAGLSRPEEKPLVHFASGVDVEVFGLQRLL